MKRAARIRTAGPDDAATVGRLLDAFNREYEEWTPGAEVIAARFSELVSTDGLAVLFAEPAWGKSGEGEADDARTGREGSGEAGPTGVAVLRFRPSLWGHGLECHLAELYVVPERRGQGIGRALMDALLGEAEARGAFWIDLVTSTDDHAAQALYESSGFVNREHPPDGPRMIAYERDLP